MNEGIPESARNALARQTPADEHPSADLLNGYVEQSLTPREKDLVTAHLSACNECREVVFLANNAVEEPALVAAVAASLAPGPAKPKQKWMWWKLAAPVVAVLALVSGALVYRYSDVADREAGKTPPPSASREPAPPASGGGKTAEATHENAILYQSTPEPKKALQPELRAGKQNQAREPALTLSGQAAATPGPKLDTLSASLVHGEAQQAPAGVATQMAEVKPVAPTIAPSPSQSAESIASEPKSLVSNQSAFGALNKSGARAGSFGLSSAMQRELAHPQWRITADGHLERSQAGDMWTRVLADQAVSFRAVSVVGNDVWAGGSGGSLFHTTDGGLHWNKVPLSADRHVERGAVVSIHFDTVLEGSVSTDSGPTWITIDGGQTWTSK